MYVFLIRIPWVRQSTKMVGLESHACITGIKQSKRFQAAITHGAALDKSICRFFRTDWGRNASQIICFLGPAAATRTQICGNAQIRNKGREFSCSSRPTLSTPLAKFGKER